MTMPQDRVLAFASVCLARQGVMGSDSETHVGPTMNPQPRFQICCPNLAPNCVNQYRAYGIGRSRDAALAAHDAILAWLIRFRWKH
jgi:hypothetical protein